MTVVHTPDLQTRSVSVEETTTSIQQKRTEHECSPFFVDVGGLSDADKAHLQQTGLLGPDGKVTLMREKHIAYLTTIWNQKLRPSFLSLDSSRPWIIYWCLHGLDLLGAVGKEAKEDSILSFDATVDALRLCWNHQGGFGGGAAYQMPHAATTYAAVLALSILLSHGSSAANELLAEVRKPLQQWMGEIIDPATGAVRMHVDGEIDVRASYCVSVVAKLLQIHLPQQERMASFVQSCQTWEGGFGAEPGAEAHGGYTFCGLAALHLLGREVKDRGALEGWLSRRQMSFEGGFSGRSNKLVDGCYSFWQGSAAALAGARFDAPMLERYILLCGQDTHGGLRDKPSKPRDFYHSCYCLSGLSVASQVLGDETSFGNYDIRSTHFSFNIRREHVQCVQQRFQDEPL